MGSLSNRIALVTGASRGIGTAIAELLASEGAAVAVTARTVDEGDSRFEGSLATTVEAIRSAGGIAHPIAADLSRPGDRIRLIEETVAELGPVDILVNNGAVTYFDPVDGFSEKRWRLMFEVQVRAPFELAQMVIPSMREAGGGSILNISSKAAIHPNPVAGSASGAGTVYGMVKAALERFSTGLAAELAADGITVNALSPTSVVATPGVVHHELITPEREDWVEDESMMARAALALVSGELNGRVAYSHQLLAELGLENPPADWQLVADHPRYRREN
ncbi:MAG: SDR family NAD(P)-dependent oxidoreductase [Actinomycetia bacterium]|nr:SDR family NAD(P)-dependent oxidoreductase [Actinomycetes bacterium]